MMERRLYKLRFQRRRPGARALRQKPVSRRESCLVVDDGPVCTYWRLVFVICNIFIVASVASDWCIPRAEALSEELGQAVVRIVEVATRTKDKRRQKECTTFY